MSLLLLAACVHSTGDFVIRATTNPDLANTFTLGVTLTDAAALEGTCVLIGNRDEVHVLTDPDVSTDHTFEVYGLLADSTYLCELTTGTLTARIEVRTDPLPDTVPDDFELTVDDGDPDRGYTLFNHMYGEWGNAPGRVLIVDRDGRVRWYWEFGVVDGDVDAAYAAGQVIAGGGYGLAPTIVNLDGSVAYTASAPTTGGTWHHHAELTPYGTYFALATETNHNPDDESFIFPGFVIEERDRQTDEVVWSWRSQGALDRGELPTSGTEGYDMFHANCVIANNPADPNGIWVSMRNLFSIARIEKATGAITWRMSKDTADFTLVDETGAPDDAANWFYGQHAPELDGDTLYVYDNGRTRPGGSSSRVVAYHLDLEARTLQQIWSWSGGDWYEGIWGDVDLLPNGHVLMTRGHCNGCSSSTQAVSRWVELDGDAGPVWELRAANLDHATYRAQRIAGCDIFANQDYCPTL